MSSFRKTLISFFFGLFLVFFATSKTNAQDFNFDKAYQDYIFTQSQYQNAHSAFQDAKDAYLKNSTLTLKEEARKKTRLMLISRDDLERVYLTALRMKIFETKGVDGGQKNSILTLLDTEASWYKDHLTAYPDGEPLESLFTKSTEAETRYKMNTLPLIYNSLFQISLGQLAGFRMDQEDIYKSVRDFIQIQVDAGTMRIDPFNRWFNDIETTVSSLKNNENKAATQVNKLNTEGNYSPSGTFKSGIDKISTSQNLLEQLNGFLLELITAVKTQLPVQQTNGNS
jgi:hypothetical protein